MRLEGGDLGPCGARAPGRDYTDGNSSVRRPVAIPGRDYTDGNPRIRRPVAGFLGPRWDQLAAVPGALAPAHHQEPRTLQVVQVGQDKIFTETAASRAVGPSIDIRKSFGVLVGDHGRLTVIEHFDMHRAQTSISMASLHREVDGSWGLRWSANLLAENPQSFLGNLLFCMFLPDEDVHPTRGVSAPGTPTAQPGTTNTVCELAVPDEAPVTVRDSTGVVIGDHARVRTRIEHRLKQFELPAAQLLRNVTFRAAYFQYCWNPQSDTGRAAFAHNIERIPDLLDLTTFAGMSSAEAHPLPAVRFGADGISVVDGRGTTVGRKNITRTETRVKQPRRGPTVID